MLLDELEDSLSYRIYNEVFELKQKGEDVISLAIGETSFDTPKEIVRVALGSMERGETHYTASFGIPEVREAITDKVRRRNGIKAEVENTIFLTTKLSVFLSIAATAGDGSDVLIPDPGYFYHDPSLLAGARPVWYRLAPDFALDLEEIKKTATAVTKAIVLNTPSNPTGRVADRRSLEELYRFCRERRIRIISDEAYEDLTYGKEHFSVGSLEEKPDIVVSLFSLSKSYAMTGWRAGYATAAPSIIGLMNRYVENTLSCFPAFIQVASAFALRNGGKFPGMFRDELAKRKRIIEEELDRIPGLEYRKVDGAFYSFPSYGSTMDSNSFCRQLLGEQKLALLPGSLFGPSGEGRVRITFSEPPEKIVAGMARLRTFVREHRNAKMVQRAT